MLFHFLSPISVSGLVLMLISNQDLDQDQDPEQDPDLDQDLDQVQDQDLASLLGMMDLHGVTPTGFLENQMMSMVKKNVLLPIGMIGGSTKIFQTGMILHVAQEMNLCAKDH